MSPTVSEDKGLNNPWQNELTRENRRCHKIGRSNPFCAVTRDLQCMEWERRTRIVTAALVVVDLQSCRFTRRLLVRKKIA